MKIIDGVIKSPYDVRDYKIAAANNFPESFCLDILPDVKNQGSKPTCVAHAAASIIEYFHEKEHGYRRVFSTEFIYGYRGMLYYIGDGMVMRNALATLKDIGTPYNTVCPGNHDYQEAMENVQEHIMEYLLEADPHRIECYYRCYTAADMKTALMTHGPLLVSMNMYDDAKIIDDVYTIQSENDPGRHCVMVYGWNEKGWLVQNSWGKRWAGDGRFIVPYNYKFNEMWGLTDKADPESIKKPSKLQLWFYRLWNFIGNLFNK